MALWGRGPTASILHRSGSLKVAPQIKATRDSFWGFNKLDADLDIRERFAEAGGAEACGTPALGISRPPAHLFAENPGHDQQYLVAIASLSSQVMTSMTSGVNELLPVCNLEKRM